MAKKCDCDNLGCVKCANEIRMFGDDYRAMVKELDELRKENEELKMTLAKLVREGMKYIQALALLPVDPVADAAFASFSRTLVKSIPRKVIAKEAGDE